MKTLLLTFALALTSLTYAQDIAYLQSLNNLSESEALQFAKTLGNGAYHVLTSKQSTKSAYYAVYLTNNKTITAAEYKNCDDCLKAIYYSYGQAPNMTYKFYRITGSYDVLFPAWQALFKPDATYQTTLTETNLQRIENRAEKVNFDFKKQDDQWKLQNWN